MRKLHALSRIGRRRLFSAAVLVALTWPGTANRAAAQEQHEPSRRELWVPTKHLEEVLQQHPNAVLLDRAQYEALIRDAGKQRSGGEKSKPPVDALVEGVKLRADLDSGAQHITIHASVTVHAFVEHWSEVSLLKLPAEVVMTKFDGSNVLLKESASGKGAPQPVLTVRGEGRHQIEMEFRSPVQRHSGICAAMVPYVSRPCSVAVTTRGSVKVPENWLKRDGNGNAIIPVWPLLSAGASPGERLVWTEGAAADGTHQALIFENAECFATVNRAGITSEARVQLHSVTGPLPKVLTFRLGNGNTSVTEVKETDVVSWKQDGSKLEIVRDGGITEERAFQITLLTPAPEDEKAAPVVIEVPRLEGAARTTADVALNLADDFEMAGWQTPGSRVDDAFQKRASTNARPAEGFLTHYDVAPENVAALVRRRGHHFSADVDNHVTFSQHDVTLDRVLALRGEEGRVNRATFSVPAGEQFLGLSMAAGEPVEWKQLEGNSFELIWPNGLKTGQASTLRLKTRRDLASATGEGKSSEKLEFENLKMAEAIRMAGYVALDFDDTWKVSVTESTGLEPRDARVTPVKGRMAWFSLRDHKLALDIARNESAFDAGVIAYALPRAKNVEIEGQIALDVSRAPLRKFDVKLPIAVAKLLRWDSPLVGEQLLEEATGTWHLTLRKELLGPANVRFHLSLPADQIRQEAAGNETKNQATTLSTVLPVFEVVAARRSTGTWVIEANTDTELKIDPKGLQPLDALHAPSVEGYVPRHRVIAAYAYGTAAHELRLTATRHEPGALVGAVVENLSLTSVLERDGRSRHQAVLRVKHNGQQFFPIRLPAGAALLSTSVEYGAVKPVKAGSDEVRIPLVGKFGSSGVVRCEVVYESQGHAWTGGGHIDIPLIMIDDNTPVMRTECRVFAPEGYAYVTESASLAETSAAGPNPTLAALVWHGGRGLAGNQARRTGLSQEELVGITDEHELERRLAMSGEQQMRDKEMVEKFQDKLQRIIIPSVQFAGASIEEAIQFLRVQAREHDPSGPGKTQRGVNIEVRSGASPSTAQISLELKDVPMLEALRYITELVGMKYRIESDRVVIIPISDVGSEQYVRSFKVPADFMENGQENSPGAPGDPFALNPGAIGTRIGPRTARDVLRENGISFPEGSFATLASAGGLLVVRNTQPNLDAVEEFVGSLFTGKGIENPNRMPDVAAPGVTNESELASFANTANSGRYLDEKMKRVIFPTVQFQDASVEEALEFLRSRSKDLDTMERDSTKRGVNIILRQGAAPSTAKITLELRDVSMIEALRYITELAGMKYKVEPYAVLVLPVTDVGSEQYTRTFKVPPEFMTSTADTRAGVPAAPPDPFAIGGESVPLPLRRSSLDIMRGGGISFPEGSSATYIAATSQLIVRNTQAKLEEIEKFVDELWQKHNAEHPVLSKGKAGLIPIAFEIPESGRIFEFRGNQRPEVITLRYKSWEHLLRRSVWWALLGLTMFFIAGRRGACLRTFAVALVLTFAPIAFAPGWLTVCNAILAGWLAGFAVWLVWCIARWLDGRLGAWSLGHGVEKFVTLLFACFACFADRAQAEDKPDPAAHTVIVPYDVGKPRDPQWANRFYLDYAEFQKLWELAKENRRPAKPDETEAKAKPEAVVNSALYDAHIEDEKLIIVARIGVVSRGAKWARLPLPFKGEGLAVADVKVDGGTALYEKESVLLEHPGSHVLDVTLHLLRGRGWKQASLELVHAPLAVLTVSAPPTDGRPVINGGVANLVVEESREGRRVFTVPLASSKSFSLTRMPGRKMVEGAPPAQSDTQLQLLVRPRLEEVTAGVNFSFPGTERRMISVELDPSLRLEHAQSEPATVPSEMVLRQEGGRQFMDFHFAQSIADSARIILRATRVFDAATGERSAPVVSGVAARRGTVVDLRYGADLQVKPEASDLERLGGAAAKDGVGVFRVPVEKTLRYSVAKSADRSRARVESVFQLTSQKIEIIAALTVDSGRAPLSDFRIGLPAGFEVQSLAGPRVRSWHREGDFLAVRCDTQSASEAKLVLHLAKPTAQLVTNWKVESLKLPEFEKQEGVAFFAVHAADDMRLAFDDAGRKVREIDPASVASVVRVAAPFQIKRALAWEKPDWSAEATIARQAPKFSADTILLARAGDAVLSVSLQVGLEVTQGAVDRVTVRLPASLPEALVHGSLVRDAQSKIAGEMREYDVSFQTDALDRADFTMDFDLPLEGEALLPSVRVDGASRVRRFAIVDNAGAREMKLDAGGADPAVKDSLPYLPDGLVRPQFLRLGDATAVKLSFTQLESTAGNAAIITLAEITTALRASGERWETVLYSLSNRSLQFLPVRLPEGAELIEASVGGQPVRADRATISNLKSEISNYYLVPLIQMRAGELSQQVKLVYRVRGKGKLAATERFDQPELVGLSAERTLWNLWVPEKYAAKKFDGNMAEVGAEGSVLEKMQSDLSEVARLNRVLASENLSSDDAQLAWGNVNKKIAEVKQTQAENRLRATASYATMATNMVQGQIGRQVDKQIEEQGALIVSNSDVVERTKQQRQAGIGSQESSTRQRVQFWGYNNDAENAAKSPQPAQRLSDVNGYVDFNDNVSVNGAEFFKSSDGGIVTKTGSGAWTIQGTGSISMSGVGAIRLSGNARAGQGAQQQVQAPGGAVARFEDLNEPRIRGAITAPGLIVSSANTYTGVTTVNAGTLSTINNTSTTSPQSGAIGGIAVNSADSAAAQRDKALQTLSEGGTYSFRRGAFADSFAAAPAAPADPFSAPANRFSVAATPAAVPPPPPTPADKPADTKKEEGKPKATEGKNVDAIARASGAAQAQAAVAQQLKPVGRVSLAVEVPLDGKEFHFSKLKDRAWIEVSLAKPLERRQMHALWMLGGGFLLLAAVEALRRRVRRGASIHPAPVAVPG